MKQRDFIILNTSVSSLGHYTSLKVISSLSVKVVVPNRHSCRKIIAMNTRIATKSDKETICNSYSSFLITIGKSNNPRKIIQLCLIARRYLNPVSSSVISPTSLHIDFMVSAKIMRYTMHSPNELRVKQAEIKKILLRPRRM